jgi:hypothetical protein
MISRYGMNQELVHTRGLHYLCLHYFLSAALNLAIRSSSLGWELR